VLTSRTRLGREMDVILPRPSDELVRHGERLDTDTTLSRPKPLQPKHNCIVKYCQREAQVDVSKVHVRLSQVGCVAQLAECRYLAGELTLSCARPAADG